MTVSRPRIVVLALLACSASMQGAHLLGSDPAELLAEWVPDDAFYYLQPAWMFGRGRGFSFDGLAPAYGFQPLWELLLGLGAVLVPGKPGLLTLTLGLGCVLHLLTGALLFRLLERWGAPVAGALASGMWLWNPDLVRVQASGLESGLVGVGLLSVLLQLSLPGVGTTKRWLVLGAACGALFLARVALLPGVALVGLFVLRRDGRRAALIWGLGALAVSLPWLVFAWVEFGQALPVSGTRKLVGAPAGLARFLADLPGVPDRWPRALLDPGEAALFDHPDLPAPSWGAFWALGIRATGGWALGHWLPAGAGLTTGLAGLGALALGAAGAVRLVGRRLATPPAPPPTLWLLAALALANGALHHLLLPGYVHYGYWYRLPELLLVVILTAWAVAPLLRGPGARWAWAGLVALVGVGALHAGQDLRPRAFDPEAYRTAIAVMTVAEGMNRRLPRGTLVGAWNAGLLGWLADGPVVVNLDGLANSREFAPSPATRSTSATGSPSPTRRSAGSMPTGSARWSTCTPSKAWGRPRSTTSSR